MLRLSRSFPENKNQLFLGTSAWEQPEPCAQLFCLLSRVLIHAGLAAATAEPQFSFFSPLHPLLHSHPTGHRGASPQDVRVPQDRAPDAGNYLKGLYRHTVMIHPNQLSPYTGEAVAQRRGRDPSKTHPTSDTPPRTASFWSKAPCVTQCLRPI